MCVPGRIASEISTRRQGLASNEAKEASSGKAVESHLPSVGRMPVRMLPHSAAHTVNHAGSFYIRWATFDCLCARTLSPVFCKTVSFISMGINTSSFHSFSLFHTIAVSLPYLASSPRNLSSSDPFFNLIKMDAITLFVPVTVDAVATEQVPVNQEAPGQRGLPWTSGCCVL